MQSVQTETITTLTNAQACAKPAWWHRYQVLNESLHYGVIQEVLDKFKYFSDLIKDDFATLKQLENLSIDIIHSVQHKCFFKNKKVTRELFFLSNTLPKLIPGLEIDFLETSLYVTFKTRKFAIEFKSMCQQGKISIYMDLLTSLMHQNLNCNSFGILESVDITNMTPKEFVAKIEDLVNKSYSENCYYCGHVTY
jgi:hypothetical protein